MAEHSTNFFDDENEENQQKPQAPKDYGSGSDEEYRPKEDDAKKYQQQVPVGVGSQQNNEEQFTTKSQILPQNQPGPRDKVANFHEESLFEQNGDLIEEINQFHKKIGGIKAKSFEDEETNQHLFFVTNPVKMGETSGIIKIGSVVKYTVTGVDEEGKFEVQRRYKEFDALHTALIERWPGCYVPAIPEKSAVGDKEDAFVEQRRSLLEKFMRECGKYEYLIESKEFKIFTHTKGEVDQALDDLPRQTPLQIIEKYRLNFKLDEDQDISEIAKYREKINVFSGFITKALVALNRDAKSIQAARSAFQASYAHQQQVYKSMMKFEDVAIDFYADGDPKELHLTHAGSTGLVELIDETITSFQNPFAECDIWIRGELLDIQGMIDAMKGKTYIEKKLMECEGKRRDDQSELDKISGGKTTLRSFFKSKVGIEQSIKTLQVEIEHASQDIENYRKLINFLNIYQGQLAIDKFKKDKIIQYAKMLNLMSCREISNAFLGANFSHNLLDSKK